MYILFCVVDFQQEFNYPTIGLEDCSTTKGLFVARANIWLTHSSQLTVITVCLVMLMCKLFQIRIEYFHRLCGQLCNHSHDLGSLNTIVCI